MYMYFVFWNPLNEMILTSINIPQYTFLMRNKKDYLLVIVWYFSCLDGHVKKISLCIRPVWSEALAFFWLDRDFVDCFSKWTDHQVLFCCCFILFFFFTLPSIISCTPWNDLDQFLDRKRKTVNPSHLLGPSHLQLW